MEGGTASLTAWSNDYDSQGWTLAIGNGQGAQDGSSAAIVTLSGANNSIYLSHHIPVTPGDTLADSELLRQNCF